MIVPGLNGSSELNKEVKVLKKIITTGVAIVMLLISLASVSCAKVNVSDTEPQAYSMQLPDVIESVDDGFIDYQSFTQQYLQTGACLDGIIVCPYYDVSVVFSDGIAAQVYSYSVPAVNSEVHSFGYVEATEDKFPMTVTVSANYTVDSAVVVPEKFGITPVVSDNKISFAVNSFDDYNLLFNGKYNFSLPYTVFIREYQPVEVPEGYTLIEYEPGIHYVDYIELENNTMIYLHSGAYLIAKQPDLYTEQSTVNVQGNYQWDAFFRAEDKENLIISGYGVVDFSNLSLHARHPLYFTSCTNVTVQGVTFINAAHWQMVFVDCKNVNVNDVILFGYRINSDGIAVCNSRDVLVENCWVRSGDDLFEVKATKSSAPNSGTGGSNITFRHNQAWAEKTRSFGFIQESLMDVDGILFEDCSSILQVATMYNAMGAFLVVVGDTATVRNVTFRNCDSYYCQGYVMNVMVGPNYWSTSSDWGKIENVSFDGIRYNHDFSGEKVSVVNGLQVSPYTQGISISNKDTRPAGTGQIGNVSALQNITFSNIVQDGKAVSSLSELPIVYTGTDPENNHIQFL